MLCQECNQRQASVHLTRIINNQKTEVFLCEECAQNKGEFNLAGEPFSFHNLLSGILNPSQQKGVRNVGYRDSSRTCDLCGLTYSDFARQGRFGCSDCYQQYEGQQLDKLLRRIHGSSEHTGKIPRRKGGDMKKRKELQSLKERLQQAVEKEAFEEAAVLRDKIRELENEL